MFTGPYDLQVVFLLDRKRLFSLINDQPTLFEVVTGRKPVKDKPSVDSGSKSRNSTKVQYCISPMDLSDENLLKASYLHVT